MSKNLFRKGLVAAAIVGLATTAFAGTPALADAGTQLNIVPSAGTSYSTFVDQNFELATNFNSGYVPNSYSQLKYKIEYANSGTVSLDVRAGSGTETALANTASSAAAFTSGVAYQSAGAVLATDTNFLDLKLASATSTTATQTVKVTAFVDANNNGTFDSGEWNSVATVTFKKYSEVTATPVLTAPFEGDANITGTVAFDGLNNQQLVLGSVTADVRQDGSAIAAATAGRSTDKSYFKLTGGTTVAAGSIYAIKAYYNGVAVGTQVSATAGTRKVASVTTSLVASADSTGTSVRTDKAFTVKAVLKDSTPAVLAGVQVLATVTTNTTLAALTSADTEKQLTVAGTTYSLAANLPGGSVTDAVVLTTDANGAVTLPISTHNFAANNTITVLFDAQNYSGARSITVTEAPATYTVFTNNGLVQTVKGTAASVPVKVYDQYGSPIADGYYASAHLTNSTQSPVATSTSDTFVAITGGAATLAITDNGTGAGTNTYAISVVKRLSNGAFDSAVATANVDVVVNATAVPAAGTVTVASSGWNQDSTSKVYYYGTLASPTSVALNQNDYVAVDTRYSTTGAPTVAGGAVLGGNVATAATASTAATAVKNTAVTVTGKGLEFLTTIDGRAVWSIDSATAYTSTSGDYSVTVYSNVSGTQTIAIAAGSATATAKVKFNAPQGNAATAVVISGPKNLLPGQNGQYVATLTDKYGNAVNTATTTAASSFKLSGAGVGSIGTAVTATGDDGTATLSVVTGSADAGTITITAAYDADGTAAKKLTATYPVTVAAPSAAKTALAVGADKAQAGAAVDVTATATNAAGAPVAGVVVTFANAGQGYLSAATATTNASGVASVKLIGNVAGANALTATANGATAATGTVTFGHSDAVISVSGKRATVTYSYAAGQKVVVSVNGVRKPAVYPADDASGTYSFNLTAGKTSKIVVSIAGVTVDAQTVKIKK